jgi:hypothetical protein
MLEEKYNELITKCNDMKLVNNNLQEENAYFNSRLFSYENCAKDPNVFKSATGLNKETFDILFEYLDPGENCENVKYYDTKVSKCEEKVPEDPLASPYYENPSSKPGPRPKLNAVDQLFLFMTWFRIGYTQAHAAWLFKIAKTTVSRYIITWTNYMFLKLGCIPIWSSRTENYDTMPECFKQTYPTTKTILDCTELFCQRPSSLAIQSSLFSFYKHHVTYKGLIGCSPSGAVNFVSELFDGSISDVEIVKRSGILQKELWEKGDSVMADRGFTIESLLSPMGVSLNIPSFLSGRDQLPEEEVKESQTIAAVRVHVERVIQRVKRFRQLKNEIPLAFHGSINQLWTVGALLTNFMPPLIKPKSKDDVCDNNIVPK